jgi:chorismate mutase/prephenate dehydratase
MDKIAVFGPKGTFSDEAAHLYFKEGSVGYAPTITGVFEEVNSGKADYGVVPFENSTEGSVAETIECLRKYDINIYGEIYLQIRHVLAGVGTLKDVKKIRSHPQAIAQCTGKLNFKGKVPQMVTKTRGQDYSTAAAMASVAKLKDPSVAAIGSRVAAEKYGLKILIDNLSDMDDNETRFFVISKKAKGSTGKDKTTMIAAVKDEAGALYNLLGIFAKENINLTKIESRPSKRKKWEYMFLIDFEGHKEDAKIKKVLEATKGSTTFCKILGSYPKWQA